MAPAATIWRAAISSTHLCALAWGRRFLPDWTLAAIREARGYGFERVEVEKQRRRRDLKLREHKTLCYRPSVIMWPHAEISVAGVVVVRAGAGTGRGIGREAVYGESRVFGVPLGERTRRNGGSGLVLMRAGFRPIRSAAEDRLNPGANVRIQEDAAAVTSTVVVKTKAGVEIRGLRHAEDTFTLLLMDSSGKLLSLDKGNLAEQRTEQKSLMPADYAQRLSDAEISDIVAYLKTLTGRDPAKAIEAEIPGGLTFERLRNASAEPRNWLTYWGDYQGRHYSGLNQINASNVGRLQARWAVPIGEGLLEGSPLVVDGVMYASGMPGQVFALDAKSGLQIWRYQRQQKVTPQFRATGNVERGGVAMLGKLVNVWDAGCRAGRHQYAARMNSW